MQKKLQASIEFMAVFIVLMAAFGVMIYAALGNMTEISKTKKDLEAEKTLSMVSGNINTAVLEGDGFSVNLTLPEKILGLEYSFSLDSNYLVLNLSGSFYHRVLLTKNITGLPLPGKNLIYNNKGEIIILQV